MMQETNEKETYSHNYACFGCDQAQRDAGCGAEETKRKFCEFLCEQVAVVFAVLLFLSDYSER